MLKLNKSFCFGTLALTGISLSLVGPINNYKRAHTQIICEQENQEYQKEQRKKRVADFEAAVEIAHQKAKQENRAYFGVNISDKLDARSELDAEFFPLEELYVAENDTEILVIHDQKREPETTSEFLEQKLHNESEGKITSLADYILKHPKQFNDFTKEQMKNPSLDCLCYMDSSNFTTEETLGKKVSWLNREILADSTIREIKSLQEMITYEEFFVVIEAIVTNHSFEKELEELEEFTLSDQPLTKQQTTLQAQDGTVLSTEVDVKKGKNTYPLTKQQLTYCYDTIDGPVKEVEITSQTILDQCLETEETLIGKKWETSNSSKLNEKNIAIKKRFFVKSCW